MNTLKIKTVKYLLIQIIIISSFIIGQNNYSSGRPSNASGCQIMGTVVDSLTGLQIEYASISIIDNEGSVLTGGISNDMGQFNIEDIKPGLYIAKIEYMGFSPFISSDIELSFRGNRKAELGTIKLRPTSIELEAVKVIDDKPIFEFEADKMVYNSSDDIVSVGGSAEDVLNKVPMVTVDQDGEVSLRGNPNVKILLNGRPNRQGGDVGNIPASLIEKIEVITSPSAKYDPEGMAGIINIVLKKGKYEGLNGSIKANGKHNKFNSIDGMNGFTFYTNYKKEKFNIYSSISINNRMRTQNGYRRVYNLFNDSISFDYNSYNYDFESETDRFGNSINLGSDFMIKDDLNLNIELTYKNYFKIKTN